MCQSSPRQFHRACHDTLPWLISFSLDASSYLRDTAFQSCGVHCLLSRSISNSSVDGRPKVFPPWGSYFVQITLTWAEAIDMCPRAAGASMGIGSRPFLVHHPRVKRAPTRVGL